jgi:lysophospholipase L1-like esterase
VSLDLRNLNRKVLFFRVTSIALSLFFLELGLRGLDLPKFDACLRKLQIGIPDPELGFITAPGNTVANFTMNEVGLRGPALPKEKPSGHYRVLFIGDSTCWGLGVPLDETFASISSQLIADDHPELTVEFLIGAVPGYSSYQSRIMLQRLLPMQPDLVVFYVGARNDHNRARYFRDEEIPQRFARRQAAWHQIRLLRVAEYIRDRSYRKFFRQLRTWEAKSRVPPESFKKNMLAMLTSVSDAGAKSIMLIPPYSDRLLEKHPTILKYQTILEETAQQFKVPYVKLQDQFEQHDPNDVYFADHYHFNGSGHELTARQIHAVAEKEVLIGAILYRAGANP